MVGRVDRDVKIRSKCLGKREPCESTFHRNLDDAMCNREPDRGQGRDCPGLSSCSGLMRRLILIGGIGSCAWSGGAEISQTACLSLSPFRAVSGLRGSVSGSPESLRDQVLAELRRKSGASWIIQAAGGCPDGVAVLDVFQKNEDLVSTPQGSALRFRLEWRQLPGMTEFFFPVSPRQLPQPGIIAEQLQAVASQMLARVEVRSVPESVTLRVVSGGGRIAPQATPVRLLVPPGPLSLEFQFQDVIRRRDTLVSSGGLYEVEVNFKPSKLVLAPEIAPPPAKVERRSWPVWATTGVALAGAMWATYRQEQAQKAYSSLGAADSPEAFDRKWNELRDANRLRNACLGVTLVFAGGAAWMEWGRPH